MPPGYLTSPLQVHFVPSLFTDPMALNTLPFLDGAFNVGLVICKLCVVIKDLTHFEWNGGWPTQLNAGSTPAEIDQATGSLNTDLSFLDSLVGKTYIAPVSPWFFTVRDLTFLAGVRAP